MTVIKRIMWHWRRIRIGEKWFRILLDMLTLGSLFGIMFDNPLLVIPISLMVLFGHYMAGYIDYRLHLSKYELRADYVQFNPIIDMIEERLKNENKMVSNSKRNSRLGC